MKSYEQFYEDVKKNVGERLQRFSVSQDELEKYLKSEEGQIKGEYEDYQNGDGADEMTDEASYEASVETVSCCLEMCY